MTDNRCFGTGFFSPAENFTMRKNFLRRKKSCCVAQAAPLQDRKTLFSLQNNHNKYLILNSKNSIHFLKKPLCRTVGFA